MLYEVIFIIHFGNVKRFLFVLGDKVNSSQFKKFFGFGIFEHMRISFPFFSRKWKLFYFPGKAFENCLKNESSHSNTLSMELQSSRECWGVFPKSDLSSGIWEIYVKWSSSQNIFHGRSVHQILSRNYRIFFIWPPAFFSTTCDGISLIFEFCTKNLNKLQRCDFSYF